MSTAILGGLRIECGIDAAAQAGERRPQFTRRFALCACLLFGGVRLGPRPLELAGQLIDLGARRVDLALQLARRLLGRLLELELRRLLLQRALQLLRVAVLLLELLGAGLRGKLRVRPVGAPRRRQLRRGLRSEVNIELNFPPNFEGLVLGCIDADFCK